MHSKLVNPLKPEFISRNSRLEKKCRKLNHSSEVQNDALMHRVQRVNLSTADKGLKGFLYEAATSWEDLLKDLPLK